MDPTFDVASANRGDTLVVYQSKEMKLQRKEIFAEGSERSASPGPLGIRAANHIRTQLFNIGKTISCCVVQLSF